jgi:hypothetical protein
MKKIGKLLLVGAAGLLLVAGQAQASSAPFTFDPTGSGASTLTLNAFDWAPSSALAKGAVPVSGGNSFTLYTYAALSSYTGTNNLPLSTPLLNSTGPGGYEITFVAGFGETTTGVFGPTATFGLDSSNPVNFFQIYIDTTPDANQLAGTGFTDGTLIMSGRITQSNESYTLTLAGNPPAVQTGLLDQNGADDWTNQQTVIGTGGGSTALSSLVTIDTINANYFPDITNPNLLGWLLSFDTSLITPFKSANPGQAYWDPTLNSGAGGYVTPDLGAVNGQSGPDFIFQVDASQTMSPVPEPATMLLFGTGLVGLAGIKRRKRSQK